MRYALSYNRTCSKGVGRGKGNGTGNGDGDGDGCSGNVIDAQCFLHIPPVLRRNIWSLLDECDTFVHVLLNTSRIFSARLSSRFGLDQSYVEYFPSLYLNASTSTVFKKTCDNKDCKSKVRFVHQHTEPRLIPNIVNALSTNRVQALQVR